MKLLHPPERLSATQRRGVTTLYLAGPFEDGDGGPAQVRSWRDEVIDAVADLDVTVIDPRYAKWPELTPGSASRRGAFDWQCSMAFEADVVAVWVPAGRGAPAAMLILGYLGAKRNNAQKGSSVVVGGDGWDGLVTLFAQNQRLFPVGDTLSELIRLTRLQVTKALAEGS
jgi:hypothetical protein